MLAGLVPGRLGIIKSRIALKVAGAGSVLLIYFAGQFPYSITCNRERFASKIRSRVNPAAPAALAATILPRGQIACLFHRLKHRIKRTWAEPVAMAGELFNQPLAVDHSVRRMVKNVKRHKGLLGKIITKESSKSLTSFRLSAGQVVLPPRSPMY
jgi:hypothetical protein